MTWPKLEQFGKDNERNGRKKFEEKFPWMINKTMFQLGKEELSF